MALSLWIWPLIQPIDHFTGIGIFLDTWVLPSLSGREVGLIIHRYKNDVHSDYPFPRIIAMNGDGKTSYDLAKDGVPNMIGECAVC